jgi:hypothetical protein
MNKTELYLCRLTMKTTLLSICLSLCLYKSTLSQHDSLVTSKGDVTIQADSSIIKLERSMRRFKQVKGYRVQIFLGPLEEAKAERNKFLSLGLPYSAYMKQIVPEHALQIGDFATRMELDKCLSELEEYYPKAFAVVDVIEPQRSKGAPKPGR